MRAPWRPATGLSTAFCLLTILTGCDRNPNVEILGSYFPGWLLSLATGVALTFAAHAVLRRHGLTYMIGHPAIVYPGMVVLFTCLLWLCVFA